MIYVRTTAHVSARWEAVTKKNPHDAACCFLGWICAVLSQILHSIRITVGEDLDYLSVDGNLSVWCVKTFYVLFGFAARCLQFIEK